MFFILYAYLPEYQNKIKNVILFRKVSSALQSYIGFYRFSFPFLFSFFDLHVI